MVLVAAMMLVKETRTSRMPSEAAFDTKVFQKLFWLVVPETPRWVCRCDETSRYEMMMYHLGPELKKMKTKVPRNQNAFLVVPGCAVA